MRSLSGKLTPATCAIAIGLEACTPATPEPKKPEVVVVTIPSATETVRAKSERRVPEARTRARTTRVQNESPTVEWIMKNSPARSANEINAEIQSYAAQWKQGKKQEAHIISQCYTSTPVSACMNIQRKESERAIREKNLNLGGCDHIPTKNEKWSECINDKLDADERVRAVSAYCNELVLRCVKEKVIW